MKDIGILVPLLSLLRDGASEPEHVRWRPRTSVAAG